MPACLRCLAARALVATAVAILSVATSLHATWSLIAIDRAAGQIGVAAASCTRNVQGIEMVVPGRGVIIVQAMSSNAARDHGIELLRQGAPAAEIIAAMRDPRFDPEKQQYAVLLADAGASPATWTGLDVADWKGALTGDGVSVQGNILVGERVVAEALRAFEAARGKSLAERLLAGLAAGAEAGGDRRCGDQRASSAFVSVYDADDAEWVPHLHVGVHGIERGGEPAVRRLVSEAEAVLRTHPADRSRRVYIIPATSRPR
jgi:uncharacterized Ntn-hydrolase superfamily protein